MPEVALNFLLGCNKQNKHYRSELLSFCKAEQEKRLCRTLQYFQLQLYLCRNNEVMFFEGDLQAGIKHSLEHTKKVVCFVTSIFSP